MIQCPMTIPGGNPGHDSSQNYQLIFVIKHQHLRWFFSHFMFEGMQPLHLLRHSAFSLSYHCQSYSSQYSSQFLYQEVAEVTDTKLFNHFLNNFYSEINKSWWSSDQTRREVLEESVYWRTAISSCERGQFLGFYDGNNWMMITLHNYNLIIRSLEGHNSFIEIKGTFERCFIFLLLSPTFLFDKLVLIISTTIEVKDRRYEKYFFFKSPTTDRSTAYKKVKTINFAAPGRRGQVSFLDVPLYTTLLQIFDQICLWLKLTILPVWCAGDQWWEMLVNVSKYVWYEPLSISQLWHSGHCSYESLDGEL